MTALRVPGRTIEIERGRPLLMGIVNASPESFSDGGRTGDLEAQVRLAHEQVAAGADLIDVGGESGSLTIARAISAEEELERVLPLVERLAADGVLVSVDTWKAPVAHAVVERGAAMINDVSGLLDPALAGGLRGGRGGAGDHAHPLPPEGEDLPALRRRDRRCARVPARADGAGAGARPRPDQIVLDPGPDFAKTPAQTVQVLRALGELEELGRPILLAASRKDFVGACPPPAAGRASASQAPWPPWGRGSTREPRSCACTTWPRCATS